MTSLGFDTLIIDNKKYDDASLTRTIQLFSQYGVRNFIFLIDFDFSVHPITFQKEKFKLFKKYISSLIPRGIRTYVINNLYFDKYISANKDFSRMYAKRNKPSVILSVDLKHCVNYDYLSRDINNIIYSKKVFPLFSHFDSLIEYSCANDYLKLLNNPKVGIGVDLNYIFNPDKINQVYKFIENKTMLIPIVSRDLSDYISCLKDAEFLKQNIGKKNYCDLCMLIQRCSLKFID